MKDIVKHIPTNPGVYLFKNRADKIIYVGKAKNLINRVGSYFLENRDIKTQALVKKISNIEYFVTNSEVEALILENNLIKEYQPKYNILLKDSKSFPMIKVTKENLPRIIKCREIKNKIDEYYGPFVNVRRMNLILNLIKKILKIRCCNKKFSKPYNHKPCLNFHIKKCSAPCSSIITEEEYLTSIILAKKMLKGDIGSLTEYLRQKMEHYSNNLLFEKAAELRDQILMLTDIEDSQLVEINEDKDSDYIGYYTDFNTAAISVIQQRGGKILGKENFLITNFLEFNSVLYDFLKSYYFSISNFPNNIFIQDQLEESEILSEALNQKFSKKINIQKPVNSIDKKILLLSIENAEIYFQEKQYKIDKLNDLRELKRDLRLKRIPRVIECFDIATLNGKYNTAAMVNLTDGLPNKEEYRQFNIEGEGHPDDYAMMEEVIGRRYQRLKNEQKKLPDLIIVDGGKGQVKSAKSIIDILGLSIPLIGIAKKKEEIFFPDKKKPLVLPNGSRSLRIIQLARDESHRFSNTRLTKRHKNDTLKSKLSQINGLGEKKINILFQKFGSISSLKKASLDDIVMIKGIDSCLAKRIYDFFHKQS